MGEEWIRKRKSGSEVASRDRGRGVRRSKRRG
jgi:hypothetical protein